MREAPGIRLVVCSLLFAGCSLTTYHPTTPRPAQGPGIQADVIAIRLVPHDAELSIRSERPTLIGPVSLATAANESCSSTRTLRVARKWENELVSLPEAFETVAAADVVNVDLETGATLAERGLFLDVKVDTSAAQGCLRIPLTATTDETMWQAAHKPRSINAGLRVDAPFSRLEGVGTRVTGAVRVLIPTGPVRTFFGFTVGVAGCRGADCPDVASGSEDEQTQGVFGTVGVEAGLERRFSLGRWSLSLALGGSIADFKLGAPDDYPGDRHVGIAGPFASLVLFAPRDALPGFAPEVRRGSHGPELFFARQFAFGRGPTESAWVAGFGWRVEGML